MLTNNLLETLEDIVKKIEIKTDFSVHHADYKPLELPLEVVERFKKMPKQMQQKYLSLQLRSFLYGIYYNGSLRSVLALDTEENNLPQDLENNSVLGVDLEDVLKGMISVSTIVSPHPNPPLVRGGNWILLFFVRSPFPAPSSLLPIPCSLFPVP